MNPEILTNPMLVKRLYGSFLQPVTQQHGLTRIELDILLFLANNPGYDTARDIVQIRLLSKSQVSAAVEALTGRGWLLAQYAADNRKTVHLKLLPPAEAAVHAGQAAQTGFWRVMTNGIQEEELRQSLRTICRMADNIRAYFAEERNK